MEEIQAGTASDSRTVIAAAYAGLSQVKAGDGETTVSLLADRKRGAVRFDAHVKRPLPFREGLAALFAVVKADHRYVPRDKTAYVAWQQMRRQTASLASWRAQQERFRWLLANDPGAFLMLDPIVTVHPDEVFFEVFSRDESAYARLSLAMDEFDVTGEPSFGTTNVDFTESLHAGLERMRSRRATRLVVGQEQLAVTTPEVGELVEKTIPLPDSWLRGFLQVQSSATLPAETFRLAPIDLYNALRHLRLHADRKGKRRGLRVELVPGEPPALVLEPWEKLISGGAGPFKGRASKVVRLYGRRRLAALERLVPLAKHVEVRVLGTGLPSFWTIDAGPLKFTLGMTGFTASNWSQSVQFDLLLPRAAEAPKALPAVLAEAKKSWSVSLAELGKKTKVVGPSLLEAVQRGCQQGQLMLYPAAGLVRYRPLTDAPVEWDRLRFRGPRDRKAEDLAARGDAVTVVSRLRVPGVGLEVVGRVLVKEERRDYRPQLVLGEEGQIVKAECTCAFFRQQGLTAGPCEHLLALRRAHADAERRDREAGAAPTAEVRALTRRKGAATESLLLSLEERFVRVKASVDDRPPRVQSLLHNTTSAARATFSERLATLVRAGYLEVEES